MIRRTLRATHWIACVPHVALVVISVEDWSYMCPDIFRLNPDATVDPLASSSKFLYYPATREIAFGTLGTAATSSFMRLTGKVDMCEGFDWAWLPCGWIPGRV